MKSIALLLLCFFYFSLFLNGQEIGCFNKGDEQDLLSFLYISKIDKDEIYVVETTGFRYDIVKYNSKSCNFMDRINIYDLFISENNRFDVNDFSIRGDTLSVSGYFHRSFSFRNNGIETEVLSGSSDTTFSTYLLMFDIPSKQLLSYKVVKNFGRIVTAPGFGFGDQIINSNECFHSTSGSNLYLTSSFHDSLIIDNKTIHSPNQNIHFSIFNENGKHIDTKIISSSKNTFTIDHIEIESKEDLVLCKANGSVNFKNKTIFEETNDTIEYLVHRKGLDYNFYNVPYKAEKLFYNKNKIYISGIISSPTDVSLLEEGTRLNISVPKRILCVYNSDLTLSEYYLLGSVNYLIHSVESKNNKIIIGGVELSDKLGINNIPANKSLLGVINTSNKSYHISTYGSKAYSSIVGVHLLDDELFIHRNYSGSGYFDFLNKKDGYDDKLFFNYYLISYKNFESVLSNTENDADDYDVVVYPNPFSNEVSIKCNNFSYFEIYTLNGYKIMSSNSQALNLSTLNSGVYIFKIFDHNKNITYHKIVKQ